MSQGGASQSNKRKRKRREAQGVGNVSQAPVVDPSPPPNPFDSVYSRHQTMVYSNGSSSHWSSTSTYFGAGTAVHSMRSEYTSFQTFPSPHLFPSYPRISTPPFIYPFTSPASLFLIPPQPPPPPQEPASGLSQRQLDQMRVKRYKSPAISTRSRTREPFTKCSVCLEEFAEGCKVRELSLCRHVYHQDCIDIWFQDHFSCPVCRKSYQNI